MVHLILSSTKGNQGLRYFPYAGYLGLTPVRVEGIVRTKLDNDLKTLQAKSLTISVRCYETRTGRLNVLHSNVLVDYTQVLWSKPDDAEYEQIGNLEFPFRISVPAKVAGFSTAVFVDYRCMWRVEAVLSHIPMSGVGSRQIRHFELPLVRYDVPSWSPASPTPGPFLSQETVKPRAPRIRYSVHAPKTPVGPLDLVSIPIHLKPVDTSVAIRSASVIVERRIFLNDFTSSSSSFMSPSSPLTASLQTSSSSSSLTKPSSDSLQPSIPKQSYSPTQSFQEPSPDPASSTFSLSSSNPTLTPGTVYPSVLTLSSETTPLMQPTVSSNSPNPQQQAQAGASSSASASSSTSSSSPASKVVVNPITGAESSGSFSHDANGVYSKTLTLQWPAAKSHSRWAIGETITSELVSVKYFVRTKVIVTSNSGTETIELGEQELFIVSTNETERQLAIAKFNELQDAMILEGNARSKSKSPRRSRADRDRMEVDVGDAIPPSPGVSSTLANVSNTTGSSSAKLPPSSFDSVRSTKSNSSRRPHTSAGPRDKPVNFAGGAYGRSSPRAQEGGEAASSGSRGSSGGGGVSGSGSSGGGSSSATAKRRSELVMRTTRPDSRGSSSVNSNNPHHTHSHPTYSHSHSQKKSGTSSFSSSGGSRFVGLGLSNGGGSSSKLSSSSFWSTVHHNGLGSSSSPRLKDAPSNSSASTTASSSSISTSGSISGGEMSMSEEPSDHMREWEEELARIEVRSRRSSDLLGFSGKRKRSMGAPRVVVPDEVVDAS